MMISFISVLVGISLMYYIRQRKAEKEMDEIVSLIARFNLFVYTVEKAWGTQMHKGLERLLQRAKPHILYGLQIKPLSSKKKRVLLGIFLFRNGI